MTECYELIDIVCGSHQLQARPVGWDKEDVDGFGNDSTGKPVNATSFHTTCPQCANLIDFNKRDLYVSKDKSENNVKCEMCDCGNKFLKLQHVKKDKEKKIKLPAFEAEKLIFRDPIADGLFDEEVDFKLLEKLDSTKSN